MTISEANASELLEMFLYYIHSSIFGMLHFQLQNSMLPDAKCFKIVFLTNNIWSAIYSMKYVVFGRHM